MLRVAWALMAMAATSVVGGLGILIAGVADIVSATFALDYGMAAITAACVLLVASLVVGDLHFRRVWRQFDDH